jgi:hypothetical protein
MVPNGYRHLCQPATVAFALKEQLLSAVGHLLLLHVGMMAPFDIDTCVCTVYSHVICKRSVMEMTRTASLPEGMQLVLALPP